MLLPKALTLDLDDTLWPIAPTIRRAEAKTNDWFRAHAPEVLQRFDGVRRAQLRTRLSAAHPERAHDLGWLRLRQLSTMLEESGYDPARADEAFEVFVAARQEVDLYPDVLSALMRLAARYPIVSITNGNADLQRIGLDAFFTGAVSAGDHGAAKPDPGIFHEACRRLDCAPAQVLHIGDDPLTDVIGARDAGLRTAWINRRGVPWPEARSPDIVAGDLAALAEQLCPAD